MNSTAVGVMNFKKPVFHPGMNTTVRRGGKWADLKPGMLLRIAVDGGTIDVPVCRVLLSKFGYLHEADVRDEHDPACRSLTGLLDEMCRCYHGFGLQDDIVAVTFYWDERNG